MASDCTAIEYLHLMCVATLYVASFWITAISASFGIKSCRCLERAQQFTSLFVARKVHVLLEQLDGLVSTTRYRDSRERPFDPATDYRVVSTSMCFPEAVA
jgi:hypothetical protein